MNRLRIPRIAVVVVASGLLAYSSALAADNYRGSISCEPARACGLGSYAPFATFNAKRSSHVIYRLCVLHKRTGRRPCVFRRMPAPGAKSSVAVFPLKPFRGAAYDRSGSYVASWFVGNHRVAISRVHVASETEG